MPDHYGRWNPIDLRGEEEGEAETPVRMFWAEYKTERDDWKEFLFHPLSVLVNEFGKDGAAASLGVTDGWRVVTTVLNHHRGLNPRIGLATATLSETEETAYLSIYKYNQDQSV
ncbi:MAG: hypothetical protein ACRDVM_00585 [Acidimicrobiia bacterium]